MSSGLVGSDRFSTEAIRQLAASVETEIQTDFETEVASETIGRLVMEGLAKIDQVAYVRFASVYREFNGRRRFRGRIGTDV